MKKKKLRPLGEILLDLEPLLFELVDHDLQRGDILSLVEVWITTHAPSTIEVYNEDNSSPIFYYGHKDGLEKLHKKVQPIQKNQVRICATCNKNEANNCTMHCNSCIYGPRLFGMTPKEVKNNKSVVKKKKS